jgi:integration host factor subunit beta
MTLSELITHLAYQFPHLDHSDAEASVKAILKSISNQLAQGERVEIRGFGSFSIQHRPPRLARNPKNGETVQVPERHIPQFRPGRALRNQVNLVPAQVTDINHGGRPPTYGVLPGWMMLRATIAIEAFTTERQAGEKYESALNAAVEAVNKFDPKMKASPSMVKKILKEFMPEDGEEMLRVTKINELANPTSENSTSKTSYALGFTPKPTYPHPSKKNK